MCRCGWAAYSSRRAGVPGCCSRRACPSAVYWSVRAEGDLHEDIVWSYLAPIPEAPKIENLLAFFNEKTDIVVDGVPQERPVTHWS